jgi:uncharacterized protein YndB with AHSA1/START domain
MTQQTRRTLTLERFYPAAIEEVWQLWTTRDGVESWWGPEGFEVKVRELDLRPGGEMKYAMRAVGADQIEFLRKAGMPVADEHRIIYTAVEPPRLLAYKDVADFIPGVAPYEISNSIELEAVAGGVRLVVTFEALHDEHWTRLAVMGSEQQLEKLGRVLVARR